VVLFVLDSGRLAPSATIRCDDEFVRLDNTEWRFRRRTLSVADKSEHISIQKRQT
jgi:hypothetical protein